MLLPEPMRPITPTREPGVIEKVASRSASICCCGYRKVTPRKSMRPSTRGRATKVLPGSRSTGASMILLSALSAVEAVW